jgi:putative addiction module component (TIGR02574 family)
MPANILQDLANQALSLPEEQRLRLAQALWESIEDEQLPGFSESELQTELRERLKDQPENTWKTQAQLMEEARRQFGCDK